MYAFKTLIAFFIIFVSLVNALPTSHRRIRRSCPNSSSSGNSTTTTSPKQNAAIVESGTQASSSAEPSTTATATANSTSSSSSLTGTKLLSALFPVTLQTGSEGWTTVEGAEGALPLSDTTLRPTKLLSALPHSYVSAPDGKKAMQAHYPKGSYTFGHQPEGGLSFYSPGPANVDLTTAKEVTLGYSVMFDKNFQFNKGGKLPGLYGGDDAETAVSCSGGRRSTACFSARFMWRAEGNGEFYTYLPPYTNPQFAANEKVCTVKPESICNPTYGASVGRGAFKFETGVWNHISERVRLNDAGQANGELELFFNGQSVINVSGLMLRDNDDGRIYGIQMQTFFGGSESSFASPVDTNSYFSDFSVAITQKL
jgi:hypothetical protein